MYVEISVIVCLQISLQMASRPFSSVKLDLSTPYTSLVHGPTPLSAEPCSNYKAGVYTLAVRLPTGGRASTPSGTSGLAVASSLCLLTPAQLGVSIVDRRESRYIHSAIKNRIWRSKIMNHVKEKRDE